MKSKESGTQWLLLTAVFVIATCGLIYELVAGTLASYLLGDSVTQFSTIIVCTCFQWALVLFYQAGSINRCCHGSSGLNSWLVLSAVSALPYSLFVFPSPMVSDLFYMVLWSSPVYW